jgi:hypothetical protein
VCPGAVVLHRHDLRLPALHWRNGPDPRPLPISS